VQNFLEQDAPEFVPYALPQYGEGMAVDVDQALAGFETGRKELLDLLRKAGPDVWKKQSSHPNYTNFDFAFMVRHILAHDYWHIYRIESLWLMKNEHLKPS